MTGRSVQPVTDAYQIINTCMDSTYVTRLATSQSSHLERSSAWNQTPCHPLVHASSSTCAPPALYHALESWHDLPLRIFPDSSCPAAYQPPLAVSRNLPGPYHRLLRSPERYREPFSITARKYINVTMVAVNCDGLDPSCPRWATSTIVGSKLWDEYVSSSGLKYPSPVPSLIFTR